MPISVAIALGLVALGYVIARRRHHAALCLTLSLVTLWVFAIRHGPFAASLARKPVHVCSIGGTSGCRYPSGRRNGKAF